MSLWVTDNHPHDEHFCLKMASFLKILRLI